MARKPSLRTRITDLIDALEPRLAKAFKESIADIRSNVALKRIVEALEKNDISAAIDAMNIDRAAYAPVQRAISDAYAAGGATTVAAMPRLLDRSGARVVVRFDVRNVRAENWLRDKSSTLVTNILDDQRSSLRTAIEAGYRRGDGPRKIALDLVGRVNRASGKREGGLIGITSQQAAFSQTARAELTSGDAALLRSYLERSRRDKRFDSIVLEAMKTGEPIPAGTADRMIAAYENRLLDLRSEMIARTETVEAVNAANLEAFSQGLEKTGYTTSAVTRVWRSAHDDRVRHTHAGMDGQEVQGMDAPFVSPSGAQLMYPGDTSLGAGPSETIGCRCSVEINLDFSEGLE